MSELNQGIKILSAKRVRNTKALEAYISVQFKYGLKIWEGWIPVEYRRTGVNRLETIPKTGKEAEKDCIGYPWYDIERWKQELRKKLGDG